MYLGLMINAGMLSASSRRLIFGGSVIALGLTLFIIIKQDLECKAGRGRLTPYQSEDTSPTLPTYRAKEEKEKIVEDKKGESN